MRTSARLLIAFLSAAAVIALVTAGAYAFASPRTPLVHFRTLRVLYDASTIAAPIALIAIALIALRWKRAVLIPGIYVLSAIVLVALRGYATHVEPYQLQIRRVTIASDEIDRPIRILHISDIQSARISSWEEEVLRTADALAPDLLIHTGDLVQPEHAPQYAIEYGKLAPLLASVRAPLGRFNVPGDTDWPIRKILREEGQPLVTLMNEEHRIDLGGGRRIRLLGLDVRTARKPKESDRLIDAFVSADPDAFNIVFAHPPDFVLEARHYDVDLSLAGHTHGGQIALPFFGPPVTETRVPRALARGFHTVGRTRLNTSAGIGAEHAAGLPSIRFNCPPEMTLIELVPKTTPLADATLAGALSFPDRVPRFH